MFRKKNIRKGFLFSICLTSAACSTLPLPEDFTGSNVEQIVAKCRCELRDGIRAYFTSALLHPERVAAFPQYADLAEGLRNGSLKWQDLQSHFKKFRVDPDFIAVYDRYKIAAIAAEYIIDTTEKNSAEGGIDFMGPVGGGIFTAGLNATGSLDRNSQQTVNSVDDFERLITLFDEGYCGPHYDAQTTPEARSSRNLVYPMVGSLDLDKLVGTFLNLNQAGNLTGLTSTPGASIDLPTSSTNLKFTTRVTGGGSFGLTGNPSPRRLLISKLGVTKFVNERQDFHTLRLVIKLPLANAERTRTIAEERLMVQNRLIPDQSLKNLIANSAQVDLSLAPGKEYLEARLQVARELGRLLPD